MLANILYNIFVAIALLATLFVVSRQRTAAWFVAGGVLVSLAALICATVLGPGVEGSAFAAMRLLCFGVFIHLPAYALASFWLYRKSSKATSRIAVFVGIALSSVGIDAFLIEPHWLQVTHHEITSSKVDRRLRIAVVADLQTDSIGDYERHALQSVLDEQPDLILFAGDYLQVYDAPSWDEQRDRLNNLLTELDFTAPLGAYAVGGNVDHALWPTIFTGTQVVTIPETRAIDLPNGKLRLTGLSVPDSFRTEIIVPAISIAPTVGTVPATAAFHICLGHAPNFALGDIHADLLVAGHTHGGQVQLPIIGPLITLSRVSRAWASGLTDLGDGRHLLVSRGIGMERGDAPRLRFLCRPEIVIIDVLPADH